MYILKAEGLRQVCILKVGGLGQGVYTEGRGVWGKVYIVKVEGLGQGVYTEDRRFVARYIY